MRIVTWNINSLRLRLILLQKLIKEYNPDIICLQETKVTNDLFPSEEITKLGYHAYYNGQKSYNGVAIFSKISATSNFIVNLCNDDARHIAIKIHDIEVHNFYVPAGGDIPCVKNNPKFKHKLNYVSEMQNWFNLRNNSDKLIITGDLNIAPYEHDVWSSKQLRNVVSHTDIEREVLLSLYSSLNVVDSCRYFIPITEKYYTWWSYRNHDWEKSNRGRRLDHILVSNTLEKYMKNMSNIKDARNWNGPSDHVPYILDIDLF